MIVLEEWIQRQKYLLKLELKEESQQLADKIASLPPKECEKLGLSLLHLKIASVSTGLFGRFTISLESHRITHGVIERIVFKTGDEVVLYSTKEVSKGKNIQTENKQSEELNQITGVVTRVNKALIDIVVEKSPEEVRLDAPLRLDLRSNEHTHRKMCEALDELESSTDHPLVPILFQQIILSPRSLQVPGPDIELANTRLNESQRRAVKSSLDATYVSLIHGPPGTGKTSTVTELIFQAVARGLRVLVCAPSNIAVDTLMERVLHQSELLIGPKAKEKNKTGANVSTAQLPRVLRLGHPARVTEQVLQYCLDSQISRDEDTEIVDGIRKEIAELRKSLSEGGAKKGQFAKFKEIRSEMRSLQKELRQRESRIVRSLIESKNVIMCTAIGAGSHLLRDLEFDLTVLDECAQGLEAACWVPLLRAKKCVLAGDHLQLPPTVKSKEAEAGGLAVTLFERLMHQEAQLESQCYLLNTQYRMNELICGWSSANVYNDLLLSHESVRHHSLKDFNPVLRYAEKIAVASEANTELSLVPIIPVLLLLDTAGCSKEEDYSADSSSRSNRAEAEIAYRHVSFLINCGIASNDIGVITPYNSQVQLLRKLFFGETNNDQSDNQSTILGLRFDARFFEGLEVRTVDGFQGGEKECIVLSLVRSNDDREVGFLSDRRRINVAVTRAKRHLCVICDTVTCSQDAFIATLIQHISQYGDRRSVEEYEYASDFEIWGQYSVENGENMCAESEESQVTRKTIKPSEVTIEEALVSFHNGQFLKKFNSYKLEYFGMPVSTAANSQDSSKLSIMPYDRLKIAKLNDQAIVMRFPKALSSFLRREVHTTCERLHIHHRSVGLDPSRYIEVSLSPFNTPVDHAEEPMIPEVAPTSIIHESKYVENMPTETMPLSLSDTVTEKQIALPDAVPKYANLKLNDFITENAKYNNRTDSNPNSKSDLDADSDSGSDSDRNTNEIVSNEDRAMNGSVIISTDGSAITMKCSAESNSSNGFADILSDKKVPNGTSADPFSNVNSARNDGGKSKKKIKNGFDKGRGESTATIAAKTVKYYVGEERQRARENAQAKIDALNEQYFEDEEAAIQAAMQANQEYSNLMKFRIGSTPIPNPDKSRNQKVMRSARVDQVPKSNDEEKMNEQGVRTTVPRQKKVLKKPTAADMKRINDSKS